MSETKDKFKQILRNIEFEESVEVKHNCPRCGGKEAVIRRVAKEPNQNMIKRWFVEYCTVSDCDFWNCGFT